MVGAAVGALTLGANAAYAQTKPITIAPQTLASALHDFGAQTGRQIMFTPETAASKMSRGVDGATDEEVALAQLLQGTGLSWRREANVFIIMKADQDPQGGSAAGGGASTVEALIVTAQKREEDIQDVPIAISAFSQEDLERSQIAGGPDLMTQVPNMTFTKTNFNSYSIQIRGIGTQAISATTDPGVAVAFNNTPFIMNRFFEQEFYDLQRVEVLRGPQGTLYGRNATAGVVNIISAKPRFIFEAKASADLANYNTTRIEGMVNIPLVEDAVALRLAGAWTKRDGYAFNEITGGPIDGRDLWSTRVSLRVSPSSALDMNLIWEHFEEDDDRLRSGKQLCKKHVVTEIGGVQVGDFDRRLTSFGISAKWVAVQPRFSQGCERGSLYAPDAFQTPNGASVPYYVPLGGIGGVPALFDPYVNQAQSRDLRTIESTVDPDYRATADLGELQIRWDITDNLTLASETAYADDFVWSKQDFNRFNTVEGAFCPGGTATGAGCDPDLNSFNSPYSKGILDENGVWCDPQLGCTSRLVAVDVATARSTQFNQEFRLSSDFEGPFNFNLGANFTRFDLLAKYYVFINSLGLVSANNLSSAQSVANPYVPGVSDNRYCSGRQLLTGDPTVDYAYTCVHLEQNSIENIQDRGHNYFLSKNPYRLISYAVFGEAYYNITDDLKVTGGLRWTVDQKRAPLIPSWTLAGHSAGYPVLDVLEQEWREPTGRLAIDWKPDLDFTDETLVYASYARGYKAGGANPPPYVGRGVELSETRPKTFKAEFVDAYELGAKNTLADGRVTLNLAAFYYDYKDYQISEIVDRTAFNRNFDVEVWGLEIEADWRPLENLKFGFKGGWENTRIADGESAVDLMDRTAGNPLWMVIRPFPTVPSSCIIPVAMATHSGLLPQGPGEDPIDLGDPNPDGPLIDLGQQGGAQDGGCEFAYRDGNDPVTEKPYEPWPTSGGTLPAASWGSVGYPGWNPAWAPNNGEGFSKDLGGNELPNAPNFTASLTADYTVPLASDWLMTLHTDLYWQSEAWWRIFNDHPYNKLKAYTNVNLAAFFTNEDAGWKVMAYVKNVMDRDSITGAFLNSDDTGLTTNVFLTEPRLYGLRVTKQWTGGPLLGTFGARRDGPYPFTLELGGQIQRHDAPNAAIAPSFIDAFSDAISPLADQRDDLDWGDGREVKLTYSPDETWKVALGARFGKTNGSAPWAERREVGDTWCNFPLFLCNPIPEDSPYANYQAEFETVENYTLSSTTDREEHTLVDFLVGRDVGFGAVGADGHSALAAGVRYADLGSDTSVHIFGIPNWNIDAEENAKYAPLTHDWYDGTVTARREFQGVGPVLNWDASAALFGDRRMGVVGIDWSLSGGVLFGDRTTTIRGEQIQEFVQGNGNNKQGFPDATTELPPIDIHRSESVTVPTYGASLGLSYKVDRFSMGAGYRWERYQDAIDGGFMEAEDHDRTIDGPYFKISVGFGGG